MIQHYEVKTCPCCNGLLEEHCVLVPNGDIVPSFICLRCDKVYYEKTAYTSFVPLSKKDYYFPPDEKKKVTKKGSEKGSQGTDGTAKKKPKKSPKIAVKNAVKNDEN